MYTLNHYPFILLTFPLFFIYIFQKMKPTIFTLFFISFFIFQNCQKVEPVEANPPALGFNLEASDTKAIAIANEVMEAMGGRKAWDDARYFTWTFFDFRKLIWDKKTGNVRIESFPDTSTYLLNINSMEGRFQTKGVEVTEPDSLRPHLERGKSIWINDSYWLVMPFKLKDRGVTLKYVGEENTEAGKNADVLSLTFEEVGNTPQNKYHVFVDKESRLVAQWTFFRNAEQDTANFTTPWNDYQKHGGLLLSGNRGKRSLSGIAVDMEMEDSVFEEF